MIILYVILAWRFGNIFKPNCKIVQNGDLCNDLNTCLSSSMEYFPEICYQDTCSPNEERTEVFLPFFCWNKIRLCLKKSFEKLNVMLMSGLRYIFIVNYTNQYWFSWTMVKSSASWQHVLIPALPWLFHKPWYDSISLTHRYEKIWNKLGKWR